MDFDVKSRRFSYSLTFEKVPKLPQQARSEWFITSVSSKVFRTLKNKFWDSNEILSNGAVIGMDLVGDLYNSGKCKAAETLDQTLEVYEVCKKWSSEAEFPRYLVPLRDHLILPTFHGVEGVVQWLTSDRVPELYQNIKTTGAKLPLGETVLIPSINTVERLVGHSIMILRAPFPSKETVVFVVESGMELTKQGVGALGRESYFYIQLVDVQITRTVTRAQWDILGYGPYAELSQEGKKEVINRTCEKYLSLKHPLRRYEFLALICWHNQCLYEDLMNPAVLKERGGLKVEMDLWLNTNAPWRLQTEANSRHRLIRNRSFSGTGESKTVVGAHLRSRNFSYPLQGMKKNPTAKAAEEPFPLWYCLNRNQQWAIFPAHEVLRLETAYQRLLKFEGFEHLHNEIDKPFAETYLDSQSEPSGCGCGCGCPHLPGCRCALTCVIVCEGRFTVSLVNMRMFPVYWRPQGAFRKATGDRVRRATWVEQTHSELLPYSEKAVGILEDAYLFLQWWLAHPIGRHRITPSGGLSPDELLLGLEDEESLEKEDSAAVLLTVQVGGSSSECHSSSAETSFDQLVQFRSTKDIIAVKKSFVGAMWAKRSRVHRGTQSIARRQQRERKRPVPSFTEEHTKLCFESANMLPKSTNQGGEGIKRTDADLEVVVDHLVLVVHGVGEALDNVELGFITLRSLIECCEDLRNQHKEVISNCELFSESLSGMHESEPASENHTPQKSGRVEFLPVEWHSSLHGILKQQHPLQTNQHRDSSPSHNSALVMDDITLPRIPHLRSFLNDTAMDILYFMSPPYHQIIIDKVTEELNRIYKLFCQRNRSFSGKVSIASHSLGSIISFDILANQQNPTPSEFAKSEDMAPTSLQYSATVYPQLLFKVENLFCLGSPIGMFLMIRNQHCRLNKAYRLPGCRRLFNIFHPYDPIAFRIEPFIRGGGCKIEDPEIVPTWTGGLRVHYKVKRLVEEIWQFAMSTKQGVEVEIEEWLKKVGLVEHEDDETKNETSETAVHQSCWVQEEDTSCRYGLLAEGLRIDYMLQEKEIEITNEYIFALTAHVLYWQSKDLSLFMAQRLYDDACNKAA